MQPRLLAKCNCNMSHRLDRCFLLPLHSWWAFYGPHLLAPPFIFCFSNIYQCLVLSIFPFFHSSPDFTYNMLAQPSSKVSESELSLGLSPNTSLTDETRLCMAKALYEFSRGVHSSSLGVHADGMVKAFNEALTSKDALTMLPNYSINPTGEEHGCYLVIDLGGSTLRVAIVQVAPYDGRDERSHRINVVVSKKWIVDNSAKTINKDFFKWIGSKIVETIEAQSVMTKEQIVYTGITWSFALESTSFNSANVCHVGKGYVVEDDVKGKDLKKLLELSLLENYNIRLDVKSILNDSLAVYAAGSFIDKNTKLALVLGTGLNMCCLLNSSDKLAPSKRLGAEKTILFNTELSLFGANIVGDVFTPYDTQIDPRFKKFLHFAPHMEMDPETNTIFQPTELMTSGRYLPELVRLALVESINNNEMFSQQKNQLDKLCIPYDGFTGELMCLIAESDNIKEIVAAIAKHYDWNAETISMDDVVTLKLLVDAVIRRAAFVVATCIVSLVKLLVEHNGPLETNVVKIGFVGSVLEYFSRYRELIKSYANECQDMVDMNATIELLPIEDSSIVGAAIGAAYHRDH